MTTVLATVQRILLLARQFSEAWTLLVDDHNATQPPPALPLHTDRPRLVMVTRLAGMEKELRQCCAFLRGALRSSQGRSPAPHLAALADAHQI